MRATAEPLISCGLTGSAEFREREPGEPWITRHIRLGDFFVTRSRTPYEVGFSSLAGKEPETVSIHLAVDPYQKALEAAYPGRSDGVELVDFFGRDETLTYLCCACAEMLSARTPGSPRRVADLMRLAVAPVRSDPLPSLQFQAAEGTERPSYRFL